MQLTNGYFSVTTPDEGSARALAIAAARRAEQSHTAPQNLSLVGQSSRWRSTRGRSGATTVSVAQPRR